eukprot:CAMPEP_0204351590 /NCGR_PEP_ID=MMETSP0469-20131031/31242_1 /ASSEMBLY_ACC=CAM_ASM_000384 /TAXON_ID=2969 /ORGANISM="Oxyrrhis marina" /LENGTH=37 /DNA_ID= /DNA_START= /DNA_END= /DNA_ORIENTATION=
MGALEQPANQAHVQQALRGHNDDHLPSTWLALQVEPI